MISLVELVADEQHPSPCVHGNIVDGHACYCHHPEARYRKCPIWRNFGEERIYWHNSCGPEDKEFLDKGGCRLFEGT